jgi:hypothetical protein
MLYSPEPAHIFYIMHRSLSTIWKQSRRTGEDPHRIRLSLPGVVAITKFNPLAIPGKGVCANSLVAGFKNAAFPDLQKPLGPPH